MPLFDHFGLVAPFYERLIPIRQADEFIERLGLPVSGSILDAGGGTGRVSQVLQGLGFPIVVADLSAKMLRQAGSKDGLLPVRSHTEWLPFPAASFERVIMVDAMHHVYSQRETAAELWRVLKPGGRLIVEEPDINKLSVKLVALFEKLALMRSHFLAPEKIAALFSYPRAGICVEGDHFNAWVIVEKSN